MCNTPVLIKVLIMCLIANNDLSVSLALIEFA